LWLVCLEVAISLRVMRPTSSDANFMGGGGGWMLSCKPLYFAFSKPLRRMLRCSGVSMPLHFRLRCRCRLLWQCTLLGVQGRLREIRYRFLGAS